MGLDGIIRALFRRGDMLDTMIDFIERLIAAIGRVVALFVLVIIAVMIYEMVSRGLFGRSVGWASDLSSWLLVAFIFLGGPWAMARGNFVRVDALFEKFPPLVKALVDTVLSTALFALLIWVLVSFGGSFAFKSFAMGERSATGGWAGPVWAAKAMLPAGAALLVVAWLLNLLKAWRDALADREGAR